MDQTATSSSAAISQPGNGPKRSAEWFMFVFKIRPCYRSYPHNWSTCPYVHPGEKARRRDPRTHSYRPLPCPHDRQGGICPDGDACNYTHNVYEDWLHPLKFRTQMCQDVENCSRPLCFFAHSTEELRQPGQGLAQPQQHEQLPAGQGPSTMLTASRGSGLPPGITVRDAAMMLAHAGQSAGASTSAGAAESAQHDQMAVLAQFRQRHAAVAVTATTTAQDSVFAGASGNAAAALAGAPASVAEADYVGISAGWVMGQCGMLAASGQQVPVLQASHGSIGSAGGQLGSGTFTSPPPMQSEQQQQQLLQLQQFQQQYQQQYQQQQQQQQQQAWPRAWASAPLPGVGYAVLDGSSIYNTLPGGSQAAVQEGVPHLPQQQVHGQQQQQQQLLYIDSRPLDVQWLGQQQQQQRALAQQQQLQLSRAYQQQQMQQPQQQQAAAMPMLLVPAAGAAAYGTGGAGLETFHELQTSQNFSGSHLLGSVPAAGGGSMPVYGSLQVLQQQHIQPLQVGAPTGSRSAPLLRPTGGLPGQDSAGTSSANAAGISEMRLEVLQAALRQMAVFEPQVQDL